MVRVAMFNTFVLAPPGVTFFSTNSPLEDSQSSRIKFGIQGFRGNHLATRRPRNAMTQAFRMKIGAPGRD
jgi:hypothetical protein